MQHWNTNVFILIKFLSLPALEDVKMTTSSIASRAVMSTDFRNRLTVPPNSNRIRLTKRFVSPYGALCFHVFMGSDSPPGPSRLSLQVVSLLVSNQTKI